MPEVGFKKDGTRAKSRVIASGGEAGLMGTGDSYGSVEWGTPQDLFDVLNKVHGPFDLDVAASEGNAKAPTYFTRENSGLTQDWFGKAWMNPPFGHGVDVWFDKVVKEFLAGHCERIVVIVPNRSDTKWFHNSIMPYASILYVIKGRLNYLRDDGYNKAAPFPSIVAVFEKGQQGPPAIRQLLKDGSNLIEDEREWL
jgi:phage N-6-adenine-methyltransferase